VPRLLERCSRSNEVDVSPRTKAIIVLRFVEVTREQVPAVVKTLARVLSGTGEDQVGVRYEAACTLKRFVNDAQPALPALARGALDRGSFEIRQVCVGILWRAAVAGKEDKDKTLACKTLLEILNGKYYTHDVSLEAILGLGNLGKPGDQALARQVVDALSRYSRGGNKVLAIWAYAALVSMEGSKKEETYLRKLIPFLKSADLEARCNAAQALAAVGKKSRPFIPHLLPLLEDRQPMAVYAGCVALAQIGDPRPEVIDGLLGLLGNDFERAYPACAALAQLKANGPKVLAALQKQLDRKDLDVWPRAVIQYTLEQLKKPAK
jgi:HEAT repeat protein